jgi:hypothetical protein
MKLNELTRVYRNLNKGCLSLKQRDPINKKWVVVGYSNHALLNDVTFRTSEREQQKIKGGQNRSVHAWAQGNLISIDKVDYDNSTAPQPYYSPYKTHNFYIDDEVVTAAQSIKLYSPNKEG